MAAMASWEIPQNGGLWWWQSQRFYLYTMTCHHQTIPYRLPLYNSIYIYLCIYIYAYISMHIYYLYIFSHYTMSPEGNMVTFFFRKSHEIQFNSMDSMDSVFQSPISCLFKDQNHRKTIGKWWFNGILLGNNGILMGYTLWLCLT